MMGILFGTAMSSQAGLDHKIKIQRLTADYRDAASGVAPYMFDEEFTEAPMLFERNGTYYAIFGRE